MSIKKWQEMKKAQRFLRNHKNIPRPMDQIIKRNPDIVVDEWISVKNKLPEQYKLCWIAGGGGVYVYGDYGYIDDNEIWRFRNGDRIYSKRAYQKDNNLKVTHFLPYIGGEFPIVPKVSDNYKEDLKSGFHQPLNVRTKNPRIRTHKQMTLI